MKPPKDRLIFKSTQLKNGIWVHAKPMNVPFAIISIYIPVGHINNTGEVLPGTAHFLEHIAYERSRLYPKRGQFQKKIELNGGDFNASTTMLQTEYHLRIRSDAFKEALKGLVSHVFDPLIKTEDIKREASIILNESKMQNKWYPGSDELGHHLRAKWMNDKMISHRQRIGNAADLKKMTVAGLSHLHKAYFDPRVYVVVGGTFDEKTVFQELSKITTKKHDLPVKFEQVGWSRREYHEKKFDSINRFQYRIGGIFAERDLATKIGIWFIGRLLTNDTHGVLTEWLRNERGWCYDVDFTLNYWKNPYFYNDWEICIPLNDHKQVKHVRKELHKKILKAITDKKLVTTEVERLKSVRLFFYQTLDSILEEASDILGIGEQLYTEKQVLAAIEQCKNISFLKKIYDKHWSPKVIGEFLAIPTSYS